MQLQVSGLATQLGRVLLGMANGDPMKTTARDLGIEAGTVNQYRKAVFHKLKARNAPNAIAKAFEKGYLKVVPCLLMAILISISTSGINQPSRSPRRPVQRPASHSRVVREYSA